MTDDLATSSTPKKQIQAILFDWGGVFTAARQASSSTAQLESRLGIPGGTLSKRLYDNEYWAKAQIGAISDAEFWRLTLQQFNILDEGSVEKFKEMLFKGERARLRIGMIKLVKQLKQRYTVALLTNADNIFRPLLKTKFHVDRLFSHVIISAEIGVAKPAPVFFQTACKIIKAKGEDCVFVDDSYANIQSAKSLGIHSIQYTTTSSLKKDIRRLGLSI